MRIPIILSLALAATLQFPTQAAAQQGGGASINKVQERQIFDDTTRNYNKPETSPASAFNDQCVQVLGLPAYCGCLGKDMPAGVAFDNFVVVLTRTKEENGYAQLDTTSKRAYDSIPALRDKCAAQVAQP